MEMPYKSFPKYVLRTPLFSFSFFKNLTSERNLSDERLKKVCKDPIFSEALFLASPSLHNEMKKWVNQGKEDKKKEGKLKLSLLKYISRMSSRCTPFGLFAGCSVGDFSLKTQIDLKTTINNRRHTSLDMNYLVALSQDLVKNEKIKQQLLFFPNTSIYRVGNHLRYIEYTYVNSKRQHQVIEVNNTEYLSRILDMASKGALLTELSEFLVNHEIQIEEANGFINELVLSQLLVSELEPSVSGPEFLDQICSVLKKLKHVDYILKVLTKVRSLMNIMDDSIGNDLIKYEAVTTLLKTLETDFDSKFLFQTDLVISPENNTLNGEVLKEIEKGLMLLNKMTFPKENTLIGKFKDAFYERYEEREVALINALDVEIGLGFKQDIASGGTNPLVDDIILPLENKVRGNENIQWNPVNALIHKLLIDALKNDRYSILLTDDDFKDFEAEWHDLPNTFSCMVELLKIDGTEKIKFQGGGGSSAANLLGRFCHGDRKLEDFVGEILDVETRINQNRVLAEVVHLPESRIGNILMRPAFRDYEIPYLAKSTKPSKYQIPLDDLFISVKNGKEIVLRSKKLDKHISPHLTNAHNYAYNSLPIYHFLCDLQTQGIRNGINFDYGPFSEELEFLPRIEFNKLILHNATWNLKKEHITGLVENMSNDDQLYIALRKFRESLKMPKYVILADGDNELLINLENLTSARMFVGTVGKRPRFKLMEFLFAEDGVATQGKEYYTNQVILSFYNDQKLKKRSSV